jgi:hypothetical protein
MSVCHRYKNIVDMVTSITYVYVTLHVEKTGFDCGNVCLNKRMSVLFDVTSLLYKYRQLNGQYISDCLL